MAAQYAELNITHRRVLQHAAPLTDVLSRVQVVVPMFD